MKSVCRDNKTLNDGLCYKKCRDGFKGSGPVCWAKLPKNWVNCGAGGMASGIKYPEFLKPKKKNKTEVQKTQAKLKEQQCRANPACRASALKEKRRNQRRLKEKRKGISPSANCSIIIAGQTYAPYALASAACAYAGNPGCGLIDTTVQAARAAKYADVGDDILSYGKSVHNTIMDGVILFAEGLGPAKNGADVTVALMEQINSSWKNLSALQKIMLTKNVAAGSASLSSIPRMTYMLPDQPKEKLSPSETLAVIRAVANVMQAYIAVKTTIAPNPLTDLQEKLFSASLGMISAYAFPLQGQE